MKSILKKAMVAVMCATLVLASPSISLAATSTAGSLDELARVVAQHGMQREKHIVVHYTGKESDVDNLMADVDLDFFYSRMAIQDDPSTSDDADYLIGNIDYTTDFDLSADGNNDLTFTFHYFESLDQTKYVNAQVPQILSKLGINSSTSNYEKVKKIHDYVCDLITYKASGADIESTMYGALTTHQALCNSYSLTLYKLLVEAGVPCKYIGGTAGTGRDSDGHAWNIVALGDKWYNVDATWDDADDELSYDYFLKGSNDFDSTDPSQKHKMDAPYYKDDYKNAFPIATTAFNPSVMSDVNNVVKIGGTGGAGNDIGGGDENLLTEEEVIEGTYPESGSFTVKRGKKAELQVFIQKPAWTSVADATYKVTAGKSRIKKIKNYGYFEDEGFTDLVFTGKKKGKVTVQIILKLINGQEMTVTFKGKVK